MGLVEIGRIKKKLSGLFEGKINLDDVKENDKLAHFMTRALAAFIVMELSGCTPEQAAQCVTDGMDDFGIDALYYDKPAKRLYFVQVKWHENGSGSIEQGEALKFLGGFNRIVRDGNIDSFNQKVKSRRAEIEEAVNETDTHFVLSLGHTGTQPVHTLIIQEVNKIKDELNDLDPAMVSFEPFDQGRVYSAAMGLSNRSNIKFNICLLEWGKVDDPYTAYYGQVALADVAAWKEHGTKLFDQNLRRILPSSEVNERIRKTLDAEAHHFWYYNNGITILCQSVDKTRIGGDRRDQGTFECSGVAIVNGAQSVGAIWDVLGNPRTTPNPTSATVHVRLIDLRGCPSDFWRDVTRNTNTQNRILGRDFASMDPIQDRLAKELEADGIKYTYKSGEPTIAGERRCDLSEAAVALACASGDLQQSVYAKREVSLLWDDFDNENGIYRALFNDNLEAVHVWRAVRILRAVESELLRHNASAHRLIAIHGNRFIAHRTFRDHEIIKFRDPTIPLEGLEKRAREVALGALLQVSAFVRKHWDSSYPQAIFKNTTKCREISDGIGQIVPAPAKPDAQEGRLFP